MDESAPKSHLSQIETLWSEVLAAHQGAEEGAGAAQWRLMFRYLPAVRRFLLAILRDAETADELMQEFALRFLRGDFHRADPSLGRFRDFLKTVARNLVAEHYRRRQRAPRLTAAVDLALADPATEVEFEDLDRQFLESWKRELFDRAHAGLALVERQSGQPWHEVLRLRIDRPDWTSSEMATWLSGRWGRPIKAGWVRQTLKRARQKYVDLLLDEVWQSLEGPTVERLEEELIDLGLLDFCREGLQRRNPPTPSFPDQE